LKHHRETPFEILPYCINNRHTPNAENKTALQRNKTPKEFHEVAEKFFLSAFYRI